MKQFFVCLFMLISIKAYALQADTVITDTSKAKKLQEVGYRNPYRQIPDAGTHTGKHHQQ